MRHLSALPILASALLAATASTAETPPANYGIWTNPQRSVQIRIQPCGKALCGVVIWANAKAQADARKGGTDKLLGADLFTGFVPAGDMTWRGKVFVPDMGKTFSGTVKRLNPTTLRAEGCLLGRVVCKSQEWTRVDAPAA